MRLARNILFCLGAGAATNFVVACCIVLAHAFVAPQPVMFRGAQSQGPRLMVTQLTGHSIVETHSGPSCGLDDWSFLPVYGNAWWKPGEMKGATLMDKRVAAAAGWPCLSFGASAQLLLRDQTCSGGWLSRPRFLQHANGNWRHRYPLILPYRPIPTGFVINMFAYAAVFTIPVVIVRPARASLRGVRGLCKRCAYPIGGLAICPECGHAHKRGLADVHAHAAPPA